MDPLDFRAWYGVGQAHELFGLRLRAADAYRRAVALQPADGRMWTALGLCYLSRGDAAGAGACLRRAASCPDQDGRAESALEQVAVEAPEGRGLGASSRAETRRLGAVAAEWSALGAELEGAGRQVAGEVAEESAATRQRVADLLGRGGRLLEQGAARDALAMARAAVTVLGSRPVAEAASPASTGGPLQEGWRQAGALRAAADALLEECRAAAHAAGPEGGAEAQTSAAAHHAPGSPEGGGGDDVSIPGEAVGWDLSGITGSGLSLGDEDDDEEMDMSASD